MVLPSWLFRRVNYSDSPNANCCHTCKQINDLFLVVREAVGIKLLTDRLIFRFRLLVLVTYPFKRGAVPKFVIPCLGWYPGQRCFIINDDYACLLISLEKNLRRHASLA